MSTMASPKLLPLLLGCVLVTSLAAEEENTPHGTLSRLLQTVHGQHDALRRSLDDLDNYLALQGDARPHRALRTERDTLDHLTRSLKSFCVTLLNDQPSPSGEFNTSSFLSSRLPLSSSTRAPTLPSSSLSSNSSTATSNSSVPSSSNSSSSLLTSPSEATGQREESAQWTSVEIPVVPIDVRVVKGDNVTTVVFQVKHATNGVVTPELGELDLGLIKGQRLVILPGENNSTVAKQSELTFDVPTSWCESVMYHQSVYFLFESSSDADVSCSVSVQVCKTDVETENLPQSPFSDNGDNSSTSVFRSEITPRPSFRYHLSNKNLTVKKGENITFLAEIDRPEGGDDGNLNFHIETRAYNTQRGSSYSSIYVFVSRFGSPSLTGNYVNSNRSNFTTAEEVDPTVGDNSTSDLKMDSDKVYLKLTLDTASGEDTGMVSIAQLQWLDGDVTSVELSLSLSISKNNGDSPFPAGYVSFATTMPRQICNTNENSKRYHDVGGECFVICKAFGDDITALTIVKANRSLSHQTEMQKTSRNEWVAVYRLNAETTELDPERDGGVYECWARTSFHTEVKEIDFVVTGLAELKEEDLRVEPGMNKDDLTLSCFATGSDLEMSILYYDYNSVDLEPKRIDLEPDFRRQLVQYHNGKKLLLTIPRKMVTPSSEIYCRAKNTFVHSYEQETFQMHNLP